MVILCPPLVGCLLYVLDTEYMSPTTILLALAHQHEERFQPRALLEDAYDG